MPCVGGISGAVIGMVTIDAPGAVQRFNDDDTHQRVWQGQFAERPAFIGQCLDFRRDPFRAADDECDAAAIFLPVLQAGGKRLARVLAAGNVEGDDAVAALQGSLDLCRFFLLRGGKLAGTATFLQGNFAEAEGEIAGEAGGIVGKAVVDPVRHFLPDGNKFDVHK